MAAAAGQGELPPCEARQQQVVQQRVQQGPGGQHGMGQQPGAGQQRDPDQRRGGGPGPQGAGALHCHDDHQQGAQLAQADLAAQQEGIASGGPVLVVVHGLVEQLEEDEKAQAGQQVERQRPARPAGPAHGPHG
ncbi:hypothetical protein EJB06_01820 [Massilia atriviolacea]|uniref:Uncharacterized protein n=1 Tax=Massilia atriviolacea TaxID=2495579 RepID=A0A430HTR6_9BURK|nr:hypothetical protein EJB06_01820 [Massilia atriviolacea]